VYKIIILGTFYVGANFVFSLQRMKTG